jgi:hypothetical protein
MGTARPNTAYVRSQGHHGEHQHGCHGHYGRCQAKDERVGRRRDDILLGEQFDGIGDGLEQTENTGPVGAQSNLQARQQLALQPHQVAGRQQQPAQHNGNLDEQYDEAE